MYVKMQPNMMGVVGPSEEQLVEFFAKSPNPSDKEYHSWAIANGWEPDVAEAAVYRLATKFVRKG